MKQQYINIKLIYKSRHMSVNQCFKKSLESIKEPCNERGDQFQFLWVVYFCLVLLTILWNKREKVRIYMMLLYSQTFEGQKKSFSPCAWYFPSDFYAARLNRVWNTRFPLGTFTQCVPSSNNSIHVATDFLNSF